MDILLLHFDAPMMSFGAPIVDNRGVIQPYPALSMMAGLIGNALGVDHAEPDRVQRLQQRLRYAVREDVRGRRLRDYQTVDLSTPYMDDATAWTTRGTLETRKGGSASSGTHIRYRDYWVEARYTVALTLDPSDEAPTLDDVERALLHPVRPLFIGRKTCLPAAPLVDADASRRRVTADSLLVALANAPMGPDPSTVPERLRPDPPFRIWWPSTPDAETPTHDRIQHDMREPVTDKRDWKNQVHTGERWIDRGLLHISVPSSDS